MPTAKELGARGLAEILEAFETLKKGTETELLKGLNVFSEIINGLNKEQLYTHWIGLQIFKMLIVGEDDPKKNKVEDFIEKLEWIMKEKMFNLSNTAGVRNNRERGDLSRWREKFARLTGDLEFFEGETLPEITEEETDSKGKRNEEEDEEEESSSKQGFMSRITPYLLIAGMLIFGFFGWNEREARKENEKSFSIFKDSTMIPFKTRTEQKEKNREKEIQDFKDLIFERLEEKKGK